MEKLFVQSLTRVLGSGGQENVPSDEFVHDFAVGGQTTEYDVFFLELDHHMFIFPINVPGFHGIETPRLLVISGIYVHFHNAVVCDAQ